MQSSEGEIYLTTLDDNAITIEHTVTVDDPSNRILILAGGDLSIEAGGRLERGAGGSAGLVLTGITELDLVNPVDGNASNAQVNTNDFNQMVELSFGQTGEQLSLIHI